MQLTIEVPDCDVSRIGEVDVAGRVRICDHRPIYAAAREAWNDVMDDETGRLWRIPGPALHAGMHKDVRHRMAVQVYQWWLDKLIAETLADIARGK